MAMNLEEMNKLGKKIKAHQEIERKNSFGYKAHERVNKVSSKIEAYGNKKLSDKKLSDRRLFKKGQPTVYI